MASTNAHTQSAAAQHVSYRGIARLLGLGALGMGAWILLSVVTALLDFRAEGAGLIGAFDSLSAFLATGAALTLVPMIAYAIHRYGFGSRVTMGIAVALATMVIVLSIMHWQAILITGVVAILLGLMVKNGSPDTASDENDDGDGWQFGAQGPGYYMGGWRIDADADDLNNTD